MNIIKVFFSLLLLLCIRNVFAEGVLPIFAGFYYLKATPNLVDSCLQTRFQSPGTKIYLSPAKPVNKPVDFIGNDDDWQQLLAAQPSVFNQTYWITDAAGTQKTVYPASICPNTLFHAFKMERLNYPTDSDILLQQQLYQLQNILHSNSSIFDEVPKCEF